MSEEEIKLIEEIKYNCIKQANYVDVKAMKKYNALRKLQQENQQLKECYCNRTDCSGRIKDSKKYDSVVQQRDLYKSVIDEVREYIKTHTTIYEPEIDNKELLEILNKANIKDGDIDV